MILQNADKELIIISGANGTGKTTFALPYVEKLGYDFLNADEIAKELEEAGLDNVMIKAGRIFFQRLNEALRFGRNLVVETTLSGSYINKVTTKAIHSGYQVRIIYIFLDDPKLCIERVRTRVLKGGHDVPAEDIIRRFYRSKKNFWNNFIGIVDSWLLLYNGEDGFQQVAIGNKEEYSVENPMLFNLFNSL